MNRTYVVICAAAVIVSIIWTIIYGIVGLVYGACWLQISNTSAIIIQSNYSQNYAFDKNSCTAGVKCFRQCFENEQAATNSTSDFSSLAPYYIIGNKSIRELCSPGEEILFLTTEEFMFEVIDCGIVQFPDNVFYLSNDEYCLTNDSYLYTCQSSEDDLGLIKTIGK